MVMFSLRTSTSGGYGSWPSGEEAKGTDGRDRPPDRSCVRDTLKLKILNQKLYMVGLVIHIDLIYHLGLILIGIGEGLSLHHVIKI